MKKVTSLTHEFVEVMPNDLKEGTIYVSIEYATVAHRCCCGCGKEVVTPLSPTDWKLIYDGVTVSLDPSIGNWSFDCRSHYWIRHNKVKWAPRWSQKEIEAGRSHDRLAKERYFDSDKAPMIDEIDASAGRRREGISEESLWQKIKKWWV
jgi:uncharacterized protein DUF6527